MVNAIQVVLNIKNNRQLLLLLAILSALPTAFFYDHIPATLAVMMVALALYERDMRVIKTEESIESAKKKSR